jgi:hypothetical protein
MTKNSATGYKCTICTRSTHPITPLKQDTHTQKGKNAELRFFVQNTTSHIFLSVCSKYSLLSQVMFRSVGSIGNLYLAKGRKEDYHRFFLSFWPLQPPLLSQSGGCLLPLLTLILSSPCVAGQACLSQLMGEDGEDQNIRRQQKMWTSSYICINTLSEHFPGTMPKLFCCILHINCTNQCHGSLVSMRIRIQILTSMQIQIRIRIQETKLNRIYANPDPDPGQNLRSQKIGFWHENFWCR